MRNISKLVFLDNLCLFTDMEEDKLFLDHFYIYYLLSYICHIFHLIFEIYKINNCPEVVFPRGTDFILVLLSSTILCKMGWGHTD